jgi:hypothetical protein
MKLLVNWAMEGRGAGRCGRRGGRGLTRDVRRRRAVEDGKGRCEDDDKQIIKTRMDAATALQNASLGVVSRREEAETGELERTEVCSLFCTEYVLGVGASKPEPLGNIMSSSCCSDSPAAMPDSSFNVGSCIIWPVRLIFIPLQELTLNSS